MAKESVLNLQPYLDFIIDEAALQKAWHGTNFLGSLQNVSSKEALKRPGTNRHNIWELAVHSAYWKYRILNRINKNKKLKFPFIGTNWFKSPAKLTDTEWRNIKKLARDIHFQLKTSLGSSTKRKLETKNGKYNTWQLMVAIALHDVYHAGQIQLIKRIIRDKK